MAFGIPLVIGRFLCQFVRFGDFDCFFTGFAHPSVSTGTFGHRVFWRFNSSKSGVLGACFSVSVDITTVSWFHYAFLWFFSFWEALLLLHQLLADLVVFSEKHLTISILSTLAHATVPGSLIVKSLVQHNLCPSHSHVLITRGHVRPQQRPRVAAPAADAATDARDGAFVPSCVRPVQHRHDAVPPE